jgi:hypothetical protein
MTEDNLQDSVERTRQMFRAAPDSPPLMPQREDGVAPLSLRREDNAPPLTVGAASLTAAMHPFFRGLLDALPEPGSHWSKVQRDQWLETARHIFALVYTDIDNRVDHPPASLQYDQQDRRIS